MEEKRKLSVFDIVNICVLGLGLVMMVITFIMGSKENKMGIIPVIANVAAVVALLCGAGYLIFRYTKKAAILYKIYMYAFVAITAISVLFSMTVGTNSLLNSILMIVILLLSVVLATAKDYGKVKTYIIAALLLIAQIVFMVFAIKNGAIVFPFITNLILIMEACIMVIGKYQDKAARGAK